MSHVMETVRHSLLKSGSCIFKAEQHDLIDKGSPRTNERGFELINTMDKNLVVSR